VRDRLQDGSHEDQDLLRLAEALADGDVVDWQGETHAAPHLEGEIESLRVIQRVGAVLDAYDRERTPDAALIPTEELPNGASWGPLQDLRRISSGGFGEVYRAFDPSLHREVALKLLLPERAADPEMASRFVEEGRRLALVRHPHLLIVHGAERHDGRPGLWTDLVEGETLEDRMQAEGRLGPREAALIGIDISQALAAMHAKGLVHRDVKTSNVIRERGGRIVLLDFGAASCAIQEGTKDQETRAIGTPKTMAPEQLRREPAGPRADLYGLGVLLYRLVTGEYPIEASTVQELLARHGEGAAVPLRDRRPELPSEFVAVVERALQADPQRRFASAGAMEQALNAYLGVSPPDPEPNVPGWAMFFQKQWAPLALVLAVVVMSALVLWPKTRRPENTGAVSTRAPSFSAKEPLVIKADLVRTRGGAQETLSAGGRIAPGDGLSLSILGARPMYVYVLDADTRGHFYVLYPLPDVDVKNPLSSGAVHRLPGRVHGEVQDWKVTSPGGDEIITVIASEHELPQLEEEMEKFPSASFDQPVELPPQLLRTLRGIGALQPQVAGDAGTTALSHVLSEGLPDSAMDRSRYWVHQILLRNPS